MWPPHPGEGVGTRCRSGFSDLSVCMTHCPKLREDICEWVWIPKARPESREPELHNSVGPALVHLGLAPPPSIPVKQRQIHWNRTPPHRIAARCRRSIFINGGWTWWISSAGTAAVIHGGLTSFWHVLSITILTRAFRFALFPAPRPHSRWSPDLFQAFLTDFSTCSARTACLVCLVLYSGNRHKLVSSCLVHTWALVLSWTWGRRGSQQWLSCNKQIGIFLYCLTQRKVALWSKIWGQKWL